MTRPDDAREDVNRDQIAVWAASVPPRPADLVNPRSGEEIWFDGDEMETRMVGRIPAHSPGPPLHIHRAVEDNATVISGRLRFTIDGRVHDLWPGDSVRVPPGTRHRWENPYEEAACMVGRVRPGIVHEIELRLLYGALARPRPNPLELAVAFHDGDSYPGDMPLPIARAIFGLLYTISSVVGVAARFRVANLPRALVRNPH
ncbi:MAG: cupin domain-containing protein [Candidatus Dormibacteraceae bacterium]